MTQQNLKKLSENPNLIAFCNRIMSYNEILNNENSRNMFFVSLVSPVTLIDISSCDETIEICEFITKHIDLFLFDEKTADIVLRYMDDAIMIANKEKEKFYKYKL